MKLCALILSCFMAVSAALAFDVPQNTGHVTDAAGVIAPADHQALESALRQVALTSRIEVAVLTVRSLGGETIDAVAQSVFDTWKPGAKGQDKGLLMLVAVDDRKVRLHPGYGLEGDLPDGKLGRILDEHVLPPFKVGDWSGGIRAGLSASLAEAGAALPAGKQATRRRPARGQRELTGTEMLMLLGLVGFLGVGSMFSPTLRFFLLHMLLSGRGGGGGRSDGGGGDFGGFGGGSSGGGGASRDF